MLYLIDGIPRRGAILDEGLERFDIAIALGTLRQHDGGMLLAVDVARREKRRHRASNRAVGTAARSIMLFQFVDRGVESIALDRGYPLTCVTP